MTGVLEFLLAAGLVFYAGWWACARFHGVRVRGPVRITFGPRPLHMGRWD